MIQLPHNYPIGMFHLYNLESIFKQSKIWTILDLLETTLMRLGNRFSRFKEISVQKKLILRGWEIENSGNIEIEH